MCPCNININTTNRKYENCKREYKVEKQDILISPKVQKEGAMVK